MHQVHFTSHYFPLLWFVSALKGNVMRGSSYRDRDYAFGQVMLSLRTTIGLTQVALADFLGVSRRAVGDWEAGSSYPKVEHLKKVVALAVQHQAFPARHEVEKIRTLWHWDWAASASRHWQSV